MSDERARVFVALDLPADIVAALVDWRATALADVAGLRLIAPESLHVTLCFLGSQPVASLAAIGDACERAAAGHDNAGLALSDLVWLPRRRPQVAAVGVADPLGALSALQAAIASALADRGWYAPETRPFLAHVTVARAGRRVRVRPPESVPAPPLVAFSAPSVTLMRSRSGRGGSVYDALRTVPLG